MVGDEQNVKPVVNQEIATLGEGRDVTRGFIDPKLPLRPQDSVLIAKGGNYKIYEEVLRDDQVAATFQQRRLAVISREWEVMPGGDRRIDRQAADFISATLKRIGWDDVTEKMLYGRFYGFAVGECLYDRDGSQIALKAIKVRKQRRFRFLPDGSLRLLTSKDLTKGEELPPRKFWHFCTGADNDDEPYGLGLAHWLYFPVFFKKNDVRLWLNWLESIAKGRRVGRYQPGTTIEDQQKLLQAVFALGEDAAAIIPEGMLIEFIEMAKNTGDYAALCDRLDAAISKIVLSQTMTTDSGSSRSQAEVHAGVKAEVVKSDSDLINGSFNKGPVRWLTDWNFPGAAYPTVWRRIEDEPDLKPQAERDDIIVSWGYQPTEEYISETYGDGFAKVGAAPEMSDGAEPTPMSDVSTPAPTADVQATALNGAQISSLVEVVNLVAAGQLPTESAIAILKVSLPMIDEATARAIVQPAANMPSPQPPSPNPQSSIPNGQVPISLSDPLPIAFAQGTPSRTVDRFVERLSDRARPQLERMTETVRQALEGSRDLVQFRERLDEAYPDLDGETLTQVMAEAMFASRLAGIFEAENDG